MAPVTDADGVHIGGSGSSGNAENGSHLAEVDAAEGHARAGCGCGGLTTATHVPMRAVADKRLVMSRIMICPVWFC